VSAAPSASFVKVTVVTDDYPDETSWKIKKVSDATVVASRALFPAPFTTYEDLVWLPPSEYEFIIYDSWGDGLCCEHGSGSYQVTDVPGNVLASGGAFTTPSESTSFNLS